MALLAQWLRAAAEHPEGRSGALRYAAGVALVQAGWIARLWATGAWTRVTFVVLVAAEPAVPAWAELRGRRTGWHPGHIAERYGLFTIIVLGEVILGSFAAVRSAVTDHGLSTPVLLIATGGLLLVFASLAAIGAGLEAALAAVEHHGHLSTRGAALSVAIPVAVVLLVLGFLHRLTGAAAVSHAVSVGTRALVVPALGFGAPALGVGGAVLGMGLAASAVLAAGLYAVGRTRGEQRWGAGPVKAVLPVECW